MRSVYLLFLFIIALLGGGRDAHAQEGVPVISVTAPFAGAQWMQGKQYDILWAQQNVDHVDIGWGNCPTCTQWAVRDGRVDVNASSRYFTWNVPEDATPGDQYRITIVGKRGETVAPPAQSGVFTIIENPDLFPDLVVEWAQFGARDAQTQEFREQELNDRDEVWARLRVVNRGRRPSGVWRYVVSIAGEAGSTQSPGYPSLAGGQGVEVLSHLGMRQAGTIDILFFADPGGEIGERDEGNNGLRKMFAVKEVRTRTDLALVALHAQHDNDGVVSELAMAVRAWGLPSSGDPVRVRVRAPSLGRELWREYHRALFTPGDTLLGLPGSPWPVGTYEVEAALDPDNRVEEESEQNNAVTARVTMGQYVGVFRVPPEVHTMAAEQGDDAVAARARSRQPTTLPLVAPNPALIRRLKGSILIQPEGKGELWYVDPVRGIRYFLPDGNAVMETVRKTGRGIRTVALATIPVGVAGGGAGRDSDGDGLEDAFEEALGTDARYSDTDGDGFSDGVEVRSSHNPNGRLPLRRDTALIHRLEGSMLLQVEGRGQAWYVYRGKRYYLKNRDTALTVLTPFIRGIRNADLAQIPVAQ